MTAISYRPPHRVGRGIQRSLEIPRRLTAFLLCFLMGGALTVGVTSCGSSTTTSTAPSARTDKCQVQAQLDHATFPASGGTGTLHVSINRECSWNAESDAAWLALSSGGSGQGDGTVQFTVATNSAPATRTAGITVNDQRMQISQDGRPCDFRLSSTSEQVDPAGGERTLQVTASNSQCTWTATADVPWITFAGASSGSGSGTVVFRVASTNGALRTGTVTVAGLWNDGRSIRWVQLCRRSVNVCGARIRRTRPADGTGGRAARGRPSATLSGWGSLPVQAAAQAS